MTPRPGQTRDLHPLHPARLRQIGRRDPAGLPPWWPTPRWAWHWYRGGGFKAVYAAWMWATKPPRKTAANRKADIVLPTAEGYMGYPQCLRGELDAEALRRWFGKPEDEA